MNEFLIECGDRCKDRITGVQGIVVSRAQHLYGCNRYWLQPEEPKDGKAVEGQWFDERGLEVLQRGVHQPYRAASAAEPTRRTGGFDLPGTQAGRP